MRKQLSSCTVCRLGTPASGATPRVNEVMQELDLISQTRQDIVEKHKSMLKAHHNKFHPIWGQMLKTGYQNSMYANLMERFACLYTSHVRNLCLYSPYVKFRGRVDVMAHEQSKFSDDSLASEAAAQHAEMPDMEIVRTAHAAENGDGAPVR